MDQNAAPAARAIAAIMTSGVARQTSSAGDVRSAASPPSETSRDEEYADQKDRTTGSASPPPCPPASVLVLFRTRRSTKAMMREKIMVASRPYPCASIAPDSTIVPAKLRPSVLSWGTLSPVIERLIHCSAVADHHAVNRNLLAGTHENGFCLALTAVMGTIAPDAILADQCRLRHKAPIGSLDGCLARDQFGKLGDELGGEGMMTINTAPATVSPPNTATKALQS